MLDLKNVPLSAEFSVLIAQWVISFVSMRRAWA